MNYDRSFNYVNDLFFLFLICVIVTIYSLTRLQRSLILVIHGTLVPIYQVSVVYFYFVKRFPTLALSNYNAACATSLGEKEKEKL